MTEHATSAGLPSGLRPLVSAGFAFTLLALLAGGVLAHANIQRQVDSRERVLLSHDVIAALETLLSTLKDTETGQRGYLLTTEPKYLEPFTTALGQVQSHAAAVRGLLADNPDQLRSFTQLQPVIEDRLDELRRTVALAQQGDAAAAMAIVRSDAGKALMDDARARIAAMQEVEQQRLVLRLEDVRVRTRTTLLTVILTVAVGLVSVSGVFALVRRNVINRDRAAREIAEQREALRVTLASIGDAVITTDIEGRVQVMNAVAEALTAWRQDEARGQPLETVFRIVNEGSREVVASPVRRALREGAIVGLANHTVLLARDGTERAIEDSAAPIFTALGDIVGCVLVFHDVSERTKAERRARESLAEAAAANAKFQAFFEQGPLFAGVMQLDGVLIEANRLSWEGCGFAREQVMGTLFWEGPWWSPSPDLVARVKAGSTYAASGKVFRAEMPYFVGDGSERLIDLAILPITDEAGRVVWLAPTGTDITDRKRAEMDRQKLVSLAENSTDFIGMCDHNFLPFFVNRAGMAMVGLDDLAQAVRTPVREFFFPEDQERVLHEFFPLVMLNGEGEIEVRFRHFKTGAALWVLYRVFALHDEAGERVGLATVSRDITERKRLEGVLRQLAADLSEANRRKDEFLATLAHELRNPLAPIRTGLEVMRLSQGEPAAIEQARAMMERQVGHMVRMVDDLIDVSRISRGSIELRKARVDLITVLHHAIETSRPLIDANGHQLVTHLPAEPIPVMVDATRLGQVFANILNNAARYTERGGRIEVRAGRDGGDVIVSVRDNGEGIADADLEKIFEVFTQVRRSAARSHAGLGIGLSLSARLIRMHGGTIEAFSAGHGHGSEFVVRLPGTELAGESAVEPPVTARGENGAGARRILVADDNDDAATALVTLLGLMGHDVRMARDGDEAFAAAEAFRPDVILLDIGMPKANGYEVCQRIRAQAWGRAPLLVALTGWGQSSDKQRSEAAGFDAHLVKPADIADIELLLARAAN